MAKKGNYIDPHFVIFSKSLEKAIELLAKPDDPELLKLQKYQVDLLIALEKQFKMALINDRWGERVFLAFIDFICKTRKNILDCRPYCRERQGAFTKGVAPALRARDPKRLQKFRFNYRFVRFVLDFRKWGAKHPLNLIATEICKVRNDLIVRNLPLAISRARIFYSRVPKSHLSYLDLINIAAEGLISGVDKFCAPFSKVWRGVCIGRMVGNFISEYSQTSLHFYPRDHRVIYRVNKFLSKNVDANPEDLIKKVNEGMENGHKTNTSEVRNLMSAASTVSSDTPIGEGADAIVVSDHFASPGTYEPDQIYEHKDSMNKLTNASKNLCIKESKLLRLMGVELTNIA